MCVSLKGFLQRIPCSARLGVVSRLTLPPPIQIFRKLFLEVGPLSSCTGTSFIHQFSYLCILYFFPFLIFLSFCLTNRKKKPQKNKTGNLKMGHRKQPLSLNKFLLFLVCSMIISLLVTAVLSLCGVLKCGAQTPSH